MRVTRTSLFTRKVHTLEIDVTPEQLAEIDLGPSGRRFIQDICPHLSADDREFLMTGVTAEEWAEAFPEG